MNEGEQLWDAATNGDFVMPEGHQEAIEVLPNAEKNETNQLCTEPESVTPRKMKRKSLSKREGAETNHVDSGHLESCPNLDTLLLKDSKPVLLPEPEPVSERNETNQLRTELESTNPRKMKRKTKRKSFLKSEGAETNHVDSGHLASCPNLDPLPPKDSSPVLLPISEPVSERNETNQVSEPVSERNETNQVCAELESTTPRKRKRKRKSLSKSEGTETNHVDSGHLESCPNLDPLPQKDSNPVLLPEPEPVSKRNKTGQLCTEPESLTPSKTKGKKKRKSLSKSEGAETNHVNSWHLESCPNLDPLCPKDSNPVVLPEPKPVSERNETNQVCTELESTTPRKRKKKSLSKSEGDEMNHVDESCPNLDPLSLKDPDPVLIPEPESVAKKNETDQLCIEPGLATPRKTKRRKKKRKSLSKSEGAETNHIDSCHLGSCSNLDPLSPKDSDTVLLPEPERFAEKNETNQLCIELDSMPSRKTKRKRKRKSLSKSEGVERNHVDSEHRELCANLAILPPKDPEPLLLPEPAPVGEKNKANQLCTKPDSTPPKFEGAEMTDMNFENLELCPKSDSLPPEDSNPLMLPQSETAPLKVEQKKKRKKKKKKKSKSELIGEGVESNRPNDEHFQHCHKAKSTTPEEWNQRKRKRHVMNETHERQVMNEIDNSSIWSMVTPDYNLRPIIGASILNSEVVDRAWVPKRPLKSYEQYERCLECRQICQGDQKCRGLIHLERGQIFCFFCSTVGHSLGKCPVSPGAKCARGIIMLDDYVKKNCGGKSQTPHREVAPANVPTFYAHFQPSNIQPYPAPMVRPMYAHFIPSNIQPYPAPMVRPMYAHFIL